MTPDRSHSDSWTPPSTLTSTFRNIALLTRFLRQRFFLFFTHRSTCLNLPRLPLLLHSSHMVRPCLVRKIYYSPTRLCASECSTSFSFFSKVHSPQCLVAFEPGLHRNTDRTRMRHSKTMWMVDVDVLPRQGKQHSAVWQMFGEQPNAIRRLSVHEREFAYNTFM